MTTPDTLTTGRTIPPPTEADLAIDLATVYEGWGLFRKLIRRCHAAESEVRRLRERVAELEAGLKPFAAMGIVFKRGDVSDGAVVVSKRYRDVDYSLLVGECRLAAELLAKGGTGS